MRSLDVVAAVIWAGGKVQMDPEDSPSFNGALRAAITKGWLEADGDAFGPRLFPQGAMGFIAGRRSKLRVTEKGRLAVEARDGLVQTLTLVPSPQFERVLVPRSENQGPFVSWAELLNWDRARKIEQDGRVFQCPDCPSWAGLGENAHAHGLATGHGFPLLVAAQCAGGFTPVENPAVSAAEINALPTRIRHYVYELETRCDPSGDVQKIAYLTDNNTGLQNLLVRLRTQLAIAVKFLEAMPCKNCGGVGKYTAMGGRYTCSDCAGSGKSKYAQAILKQIGEVP